MYVARDQWSQPDTGDPPPCFRMGDLVRLIWATVVADPPCGNTQQVRVELRTEVVALLSADCDLVDRVPPKRKGVQISPLRDVPKNIANKSNLLEALKAPSVQPAGGQEIPVNLFYFAPVDEPAGTSSKEGVTYLEAMTMLPFSSLKAGTKIAELTDERRQDLRERLKFHFGRLA